MALAGGLAWDWGAPAVLLAATVLLAAALWAVFWFAENRGPS